MSTLEERLASNYNPLTENDSWAPTLSERYPHLTEALQGAPGWKPGSKGQPPMTLMLFAKDGKLKATLSNAKFPMAWTAVLEAGIEPLTAVEGLLATGGGDVYTKRQD